MHAHPSRFHRADVDRIAPDELARFRAGRYLAIMKASERWTRPVQDWTAALNHFALVFPDRVPA